MNWLKQYFSDEDHIETKAIWTEKNILTVTLGSKIRPGDKLYINIKVCDNVDIYPGTIDLEVPSE